MEINRTQLFISFLYASLGSKTAAGLKPNFIKKQDCLVA